MRLGLLGSREAEDVKPTSKAEQTDSEKRGHYIHNASLLMNLFFFLCVCVRTRTFYVFQLKRRTPNLIKATLDLFVLLCKHKRNKLGVKMG